METGDFMLCISQFPLSLGSELVDPPSSWSSSASLSALGHMADKAKPRFSKYTTLQVCFVRSGKRSRGDRRLSKLTACRE
jgi:hypothetical protein